MEPLQDWRSPQFEEQLSRLDRGGVTFEFLRRNTRRHVASVLLNRDVVTLRAIDWKNAPERRQLGRILAAAREHIENGYMRWLVPRTSRSARDTERD